MQRWLRFCCVIICLLHSRQHVRKKPTHSSPFQSDKQAGAFEPFRIASAAGRTLALLSAIAAAAVHDACSRRAGADVIELLDGSFVEGIVESENRDRVLLRTPVGPRRFPRESVREIARGVSIFDVFDARRKALDTADVPGFLKLAAWVKGLGYDSTARKTLEHVLCLDPDNLAARDGLGHKFVNGKWLTDSDSVMIELGMRRVSGQWLGPAEFESRKDSLALIEGEWFLAEHAALLARGEPARLPDAEGFRVFRTPRYLIRAAIAPEHSESLARLSEALHRALEKYFGAKPAFLLHAVVFRDASAFAEYTSSRREPWMPPDSMPDGYFNPETRTVYTGFGGTARTPGVLAHELVHQFEWGVRPDASPPAWLREGLACFFSVHAFDGKELKTGLLNPESNLHYEYLRKLFRAGKEWPLADVLSPGPGRAADPHFYDHAWSLVYYLENGAPPELKKGFARYRGMVLAGRDSGDPRVSDSLSSCMGSTDEELEKRWKGYWKGVFGID